MLRDAASMGLAPFYKIIGSPVRRTIQLLGASAFVPEGDIYDVYHKIKPTLSDDVGEFFQYIESTWISSPGSPDKYLQQFQQNSRVFDHPSFHIFCEAILTEQDLTAGKI